jgi:chitobiase/beta-hexosaminidase-like protein
MNKMTLSFEIVAAILAVAILQACAGRTPAMDGRSMTTTAKSQCEKPTLNPQNVSAKVGTLITVRIKTATNGAKLRYTLTGSTPSNGSMPGDSGDVTFRIEVFGRTLTATANKPGSADSLPEQGHYLPK